MFKQKNIDWKFLCFFGLMCNERHLRYKHRFLNYGRCVCDCRPAEWKSIMVLHNLQLSLHWNCCNFSVCYLLCISRHFKLTNSSIVKVSLKVLLFLYCVDLQGLAVANSKSQSNTVYIAVRGSVTFTATLVKGYMANVMFRWVLLHTDSRVNIHNCIV